MWRRHSIAPARSGLAATLVLAPAREGYSTVQTDARGRPIEVIVIPEAESVETDDDRFCRSYVNSYLVNGGVVMPAYGVPEDGLARETWQALFPDREVALVDISAIAPGGGGIHCITQQQPLWPLEVPA